MPGRGKPCWPRHSSTAQAASAPRGASPGARRSATTIPRRDASCIRSTATLCWLETGDAHVNLVDTPGYPDFIGRTLPILEAVETAAVVVSAVAGVEAMSQRMMDAARDRGLCRIVVINKIDAREANPEATLEEIREQFGSECLPINLPAAGGSKVIDCFFHNDGEATDFSSVQEAHTRDHRPGRRSGRRADGPLSRAGRGARA